MQLLGIGLILILLMGLLSPLESMGWWAGWSDVDKDKPKEPGTPQDQETQESTGQSEAGHYMVYLSGIGAIAGDFLEKEEIAFMDKVEARVPGTAAERGGVRDS